MIFSIFPKYSARNASPVLEAFVQGLRRHAITVTDHDLQGDVAVLWSQLWAGRMRTNKDVYQIYSTTSRPIIIIDVGTICRNQTWRITLQNNAYLAGHGHDRKRRDTLGMVLRPWNSRGRNIVIAMQRPDSNQWCDMPDCDVWLRDTVQKIRACSQRPILIRSHPRYPLMSCPENTLVRLPQHIAGTYDDFDFDQCLDDAWAVINWNSSPGILSVLNGVPAFVGASSLAAPVANLDLATIDNPAMPDREQWANDLAWTEWTVDEICHGVPQQYILDRVRGQ